MFLAGGRFQPRVLGDNYPSQFRFADLREDGRLCGTIQDQGTVPEMERRRGLSVMRENRARL